MNEIIKGMIDGYIGTFDMYTISSQSLQEQVDDFKKKMTTFANQNSDVATFYTKLAASGLMEEHSALITKVAMASMGSANADGTAKTDYSDTPSAPVVSVKDFVEQYRVSYDEVKKAGYRKRGEVAYENIFEVANRTEDMLDAQIIIENERLMWHIVTEVLDTFEATLEAMDPLQRQITCTLENQIDMYKNANSAEELDYKLQLSEYQTFKCVQHNMLNNVMPSLFFAYLLISVDPPTYCISKQNVQESGGEKGIEAFIANFKALQRTQNFLKLFYNKSFDDILSNESAKIWLLSPANADVLGKIKTSLNPHNFNAYKDILDNEISGSTSLIDILKRQPEIATWSNFYNTNDRDNYLKMAKETASQLNQNLTYYTHII